MKRIMSCLALVALAVFTSAAFAQDPAAAQQPAASQEAAATQEPTLTSVEAKFDTTTDNKDQQTKLDVYLKNSGGQEVAKAEGNEGRWNKNSTHTVALQLEGNATKAEVANGTVSLTLHPQRRNKWSFNYKVTLKFSDDSVITKDFNGCLLTEHDPGRKDSFN
jgi:methionine-rich copper-binding protein CopC